MRGTERAAATIRHCESGSPRDRINGVATSHEIELEVRRFVADNFSLSADAGDLDASVSLTETGLLDSMGILELIMFLEERFGVTISNEEALPENLDSVERIVVFVGAKLRTA